MEDEQDEVKTFVVEQKDSFKLIKNKTYYAWEIKVVGDGALEKVKQINDEARKYFGE